MMVTNIKIKITYLRPNQLIYQVKLMVYQKPEQNLPQNQYVNLIRPTNRNRMLDNLIRNK